MIWTVISISLRRLRHAPIELMLTFVVPIIFFSIFAMIFGSGIGRTPNVRTLIVDADKTDLSRDVVDALASAPGLKPTVFNSANFDGDLETEARRLIREGQYSAAVVLPKSLSASVSDGREMPKIEVLSDSSNQVAAQVVGAVVQQSVMTKIAAIKQARAMSATTTRPLLEPNADKNRVEVAQRVETADSEATRSIAAKASVIELVDVLGDDKSNPLIAMSAAGIAVMFLLFSSAGSGGSLLEEEEIGTLERMLTSRLTMSQLLIGKWLFIAGQGVVQLTVMFLWGHLVFDVDLFGHLPGFLVMTAATSAAAASFALVLATACKTRSQLNGVSTILILTMSALGGSMVPRYVMSPEMQQWGLVTFNAWALDGYNKIFWRDMPVESLFPQLCFLIGSSFALMTLARLLARRWESV